MVAGDLRIDYKNHRSEGVRALEQFWAVKLEMCSDLASIKKDDEQEFARRLQERILIARQNAPPSPPRSGRKRDSSPSTGTSGSSSSSSPPRVNAHQVSAKQTVKFVPRYKEQAECLAAEGHNPRLQLIFKASKSIGSIVSHMKRKWTSKRSGTTLTSGLRIYPGQEMGIPHPGWGEQDTTPVADIAAHLKRQGALTLEYAWPYEVIPPEPDLPVLHPALQRLTSAVQSTHGKQAEQKDRPLKEERDEDLYSFSFSAESSLPSLFNAAASMPGSEGLTNVRDEEKAAHSFYSSIEQISTPPHAVKELPLPLPTPAAAAPLVTTPTAAAANSTAAQMAVKFAKRETPEAKTKLVMSEDALMEFPVVLSEDTLRELDGHALALSESNSLGLSGNLLSNPPPVGVAPAALLSSVTDWDVFGAQGSRSTGAPDSPPKKKPRPKQ